MLAIVNAADPIRQSDDHRGVVLPEYKIPSFHELTPELEITNRLAGIQPALAALEMDAALIIEPVDFFYFSGTMQAGHLFLPAHGYPRLLIRRNLARALAESPLPAMEVISFKQLQNMVKEVLGQEPRRLGLELDVLPVRNFQRYQALWPKTEFVDVSPAIIKQRAVKSKYELSWMHRAGQLARAVYARIPGLLRPGLTEIELAGLISNLAYAAGHQNDLRMRAFDQANYSWHVISGVSGGIASRLDASFAGYGLSPAFPMGASLKPIFKNEPILIDFGMCLGGYQVDLTRMFAMGRPAEMIIEAYQVLQTIETELAANLQPGQVPENLYNQAVATAERLGFGHAFLGPPEGKVKFAGHGVGLEVSEPPVLAPGQTTPIQAGMTVALELKMVFPGVGAVGLENTFLVTTGTPVKLTPADDEFIVV